MAMKRRPRVSAQDPRQRVIAAALDLAAKEGWRGLGLAEIAAAARVPLAELYRLFRSRTGILVAFRRGIDEAVLGEGPVAAEGSARDRLFEILMRRFERLKPYRPGLRAILRDGDPTLLCLLPGVLRSMAWMLEAAGIAAGGVRGRLARRLVAAIYLSVLPTFFRDEGRDLGTTMAALDRRLRQAETMVTALAPLLARRRRRRRA